MIFCNTREETRLVYTFLAGKGLPVAMLSSDLPQKKREKVMGRFRTGEIRHLVTTDVASRGIDIEDLSHVFIFSTPDSPEQYIHRAGRTGRVGKSGRAISLVSAHDLMNFNRLVKRYHVEVRELAVPSDEEVQAAQGGADRDPAGRRGPDAAPRGLRGVRADRAAHRRPRAPRPHRGPAAAEVLRGRRPPEEVEETRAPSAGGSAASRPRSGGPPATAAAPSAAAGAAGAKHRPSDRLPARCRRWYPAAARALTGELALRDRRLHGVERLLHQAAQASSSCSSLGSFARQHVGVGRPACATARCRRRRPAPRSRPAPRPGPRPGCGTARPSCSKTRLTPTIIAAPPVDDHGRARPAPRPPAAASARRTSCRRGSAPPSAAR